MGSLHLPSYHHLSPCHIPQLKFDVKIRCIRTGQTCDDDIDCTSSPGNAYAENNFSSASASRPRDSLVLRGNNISEPIISKEVCWQEKIKPSSSSTGVAIFTYTQGDMAVKNATEPASTEQTHSKLIPSLTAMGKQRRLDREDRSIREDGYETMMIMASAQGEEMMLCKIVTYKSGLIMATPAFSVIEAEDYDGNNVFISHRGVEEVINNGQRLTTYSFSTCEGIYEYSVEYSLGESRSDFNDDELVRQNDLNRQRIEHRQELILKEFECSGRIYEDCSRQWSNHVCIELVSADGFLHPNMLLCFGSSLMIKYRLLDGDKVVLKGHSNRVQSSHSVNSSVEFTVCFTLALVAVIFAGVFSFGGIGSDFSLAMILSIVPLFLLLSPAADNDGIYNINHQFLTMFNTERQEINGITSDKVKLELSAILFHNFGVVSVAGCGIVSIPTKPGNYDLEAMTWKPIAVSSHGVTRSQLHDYYLGSSFDEIGATDSAQTKDCEQDWAKEMNTNLFSKHDLHSHSSGKIRLRVNVTRNAFNQEKMPNWYSTSDGSESQSQRVYIRETVDEILDRVRRNKRQRMREVNPEESPATTTKTERGETEIGGGNLSAQAKGILERVRSRQNSSSYG